LNSDITLTLLSSPIQLQKTKIHPTPKGHIKFKVHTAHKVSSLGHLNANLRFSRKISKKAVLHTPRRNFPSFSFESSKRCYDCYFWRGTCILSSKRIQIASDPACERFKPKTGKSEPIISDFLRFTR